MPISDLDAAIRAALPEAAVLTAQPAPVVTEWAAELLQRLYGLSGQLAALSGERDANFLVTPADGSPRCMLKLSHPDEALLVADFQTQALLHVAATDPGLPVQRLLPDLQGGTSVEIQDAQGRTRVARLFSYLEGLPMPQAHQCGPCASTAGSRFVRTKAPCCRGRVAMGHSACRARATTADACAGPGASRTGTSCS